MKIMIKCKFRDYYFMWPRNGVLTIFTDVHETTDKNKFIDT